MFCREQAVQVHRERDTIRERGAELVFIGNGNRHSAEAFQKQFDIRAPLYVDTKRDAYRELGMRRGARDIFNRLQTKAADIGFMAYNAGRAAEAAARVAVARAAGWPRRWRPGWSSEPVRSARRGLLRPRCPAWPG